MTTDRKAFELFSLPGGVTGVPERLTPASFKEWEALEVQHIEPWIVQRPELLGEELLIITNQFQGFEVKDRLDVLALDRAGRLVVIEVKRDTSGAYQDLQALRYAALASTFTADQLVEAHRAYVTKKGDPDPGGDGARRRIEEFVASGDLSGVDDDDSPRIILVAGAFEVGVTTTVLWLRRVHKVDITCVQLVPYQVGGELVVGSAILIPLPEAGDYEAKVAEKEEVAATGSKAASMWNPDRARQFIASIPKGRWAAYKDVAIAGGVPKGAMGAAAWITATKQEIPLVYRVLTAAGRVSPGWKTIYADLPQTPDDVRKKLTEEGVTFTDDHASQDQRWTAVDFEASLPPEAVQPEEA
ncbi:MAG: hypothetical protein AB7V42_14610 [Thermoleophilia bacterium]